MGAISEWMFWMDVLIFAYVLYAFWYERPSTRNSLHFFIPLTFPYIVWCLCGSRFSQSVKYVLKVILLYFILSLLFPYHIHIFYGKLNENGDISSSIPTGRKWKQKNYVSLNKFMNGRIQSMDVRLIDPRGRSDYLCRAERLVHRNRAIPSFVKGKSIK